MLLPDRCLPYCKGNARWAQLSLHLCKDTFFFSDRVFCVLKKRVMLYFIRYDGIKTAKNMPLFAFLHFLYALLVCRSGFLFIFATSIRTFGSKVGTKHENS